MSKGHLLRQSLAEGRLDWVPRPACFHCNHRIVPGFVSQYEIQPYKTRLPYGPTSLPRGDFLFGLLVRFGEFPALIVFSRKLIRKLTSKSNSIMSVPQENRSGVGAPLGNDNAVGNSGGGAPIENSNAVGNSGGGAPEGNTNRKSHGVYCDLEKIDERAEGEVAAFIEGMEAIVRERADGDPGELAREIPLRIIRFERAVHDIHRRGIVLDDGGVNSMLPTSRRILDGIFEDLREIGVL